MGRSGILAAGNWIVDHVKMIDEFPRQDALVSITSESDSNGGGPYNLLKDLALLGAEFPLAGAGLVGDDADGTAILADCEAHGIDASQILICDSAPTSYTDVMTVSADGRRTFFHQRGANALFDGAKVDLSGSQGRIFYLGYLLLLDSLDQLRGDGSTLAADLLEQASAQGFETAVDLVSAQSGKFAQIVLPSLPHVDYLFLNEYEAGALLGIELEEADQQSLLAAAVEIRALGVRGLVIIHRPDGAALAGHESSFWQGSVAIPEGMIAGAVGAGDAFAAGMLLGLHQREPLDQCLRQAVCSAAMCLLDPTTS
ncbi:MAG: carbohydrate kinase family protein, partial [Verrucomicrobiales bacterium]